MILFKQEHVAPILSGRKTQTRRIGKLRWKEGSIHQAKTNFKKDGMFAKLRIKAVRQEKLGLITPADARAEGYDTIADYVAAYERIYKTKWDDEQVVWVIDFERVEEPA